MKMVLKHTLWIVILSIFVFSCNDDDTDTPGNPSLGESTVDVKVVLPEGATADLSGTTLFSLGTSSDLTSQTGKIPFNKGTIELSYLLDKDNNVWLAGFLDDTRKEVSIETTTEVMLYYLLDYYLLPESGKKAFLADVKKMAGFSDLVDVMSGLFKSDPLMYSKGTYLPKLTEKVSQISAINTSAQLKRLFINGENTKSGITVSKIDSVHIQLKNSFPRRTKVMIYKKLTYDRNKNLNNIPGYQNYPVTSFDFEPGKKMQIDAFEVGASLSQISTQSAMAENTSTSEPVELPLNKSTEFVAEYEVVVIGSGELNSIERNLTELEKEANEQLNIKSYALDYLLPTLLDIGGNKDLLPSYGSDKETALFNAVSPVLEANPQVLSAIKSNDFKTASETLLPELYGDIRLTDGLRTLLSGVYGIVSDNGTLPNTFVQSHELTETGYQRTKKVMEAMYKNMNFKSKHSITMLPTDAKTVESWIIDAIDAEVELVPKEAEVCLGDAISIRVSYLTFYEPSEEDIEYHWNTSNKFGGKIQDINGDPNRFGATLVTTSNEVSYISTATASQLGESDNIETVTVVIYTRNKKSGELSEVGRDAMKVNNKKTCTSFFVPFDKEVEIAEVKETLICNMGTMYSLSVSYFVAKFTAVDGAKSYRGRIMKKDGTYADEFAITNLSDLGNDVLEYKLAVGGIRILQTCNESEALNEQQKRLNNLDEVGHKGIEITPQF